MGIFAKMIWPFLGLLAATTLAWSCKELEGMTPELDTSPKAVRILALGDSYTIGQSVPESARWPMQLADSLASDSAFLSEVQIIARTGWRTDNLQQAISIAAPDSAFDLVTLLIGVNNQYQGRSLAEYEQDFQELLETAKTLAQGDLGKVLVISIPDYGYTPFGSAQQASISSAIDLFNAANKRLTEQAGIAYVDITPISRQGLVQPDLVADDGLHPSGTQYAAWVHQMLPMVRQILD